MPSIHILLLHVTSEGVYELEHDTKSQYGHTYLAGTKVLPGHFLNYQKTTRGYLYKKDMKVKLYFLGFTNRASTFSFSVPRGSNALKWAFEAGEHFYPNIMFTPACMDGSIYRKLENPMDYCIKN